VDEHPDVFESVRGTGLMLGLKCRVPAKDVVSAGYGQRVLVIPAAEEVVRLLPALTISDDEIGEAIARLDRAAAAVRAEAAA
jgi:acetylornithine/N-succinyldiaminopimelate aminotransferase